jgi:hypothetical protein
VAVVDFKEGDLPVGPPAAHKLTGAEIRADFEAAGFRLTASPDVLPYQYLFLFELEAKTPAACLDMK